LSPGLNVFLIFRKLFFLGRMEGWNKARTRRKEDKGSRGKISNF